MILLAAGQVALEPQPKSGGMRGSGYGSPRNVRELLWWARLGSCRGFFSR